MYLGFCGLAPGNPRRYWVSVKNVPRKCQSRVRAYIRNQEDEDERYDQMKLAMG